MGHGDDAVADVVVVMGRGLREIEEVVPSSRRHGSKHQPPPVGLQSINSFN